MSKMLVREMDQHDKIHRGEYPTVYIVNEPGWGKVCWLWCPRCGIISAGTILNTVPYTSRTKAEDRLTFHMARQHEEVWNP